MNRFYADVDFEIEPVLRDEEEIRHLTTVLRHGVGDKVEVFDRNGKEYFAIIDKIEKKQVLFSIEERIPLKKRNAVSVTLYQGIAKGARMEFVAQKCTELGADKIVPVRFSRCVAKLEKKDKKVERWNKICFEAAKQSKRNTLCLVTEAIDFEELLQKMEENDLNLFLYEEEEKTGLKSFLQNWRKEKRPSSEEPKKIGLIVGPEGGIDEVEAERLRSRGLIPLTLGQHILRTETVGQAVMAMISYEFSE